MQFDLNQSSAAAEEMATQLIKSNYEATVLSLLPSVDPRLQFLKSNALKVGVSEREFNDYSALFVRAGFWQYSKTKVDVNFDLMNVGEISVQDYLHTTLNIISRLSSKHGDSVYETTSVATTRELAKEFIHSINKAFRQFYDKSNESEKTVIFSWAHAGIVAHENKSKLKPARPQEQ